MSMTRIAKSAIEPPRLLNVVKASCPGVSINNNPGILTSIFSFLRRSPQNPFITSMGMKEVPVPCVIPPASPFWTIVPLIESKIDVLPWSTFSGAVKFHCPRTTTIGCLIDIFITYYFSGHLFIILLTNN